MSHGEKVGHQLLRFIFYMHIWRASMMFRKHASTVGQSHTTYLYVDGLLILCRALMIWDTLICANTGDGRLPRHRPASGAPDHFPDRASSVHASLVCFTGKRQCHAVCRGARLEDPAIGDPNTAPEKHGWDGPMGKAFFFGVHRHRFRMACSNAR